MVTKDRNDSRGCRRLLVDVDGRIQKVFVSCEEVEWRCDDDENHVLTTTGTAAMESLRDVGVVDMPLRSR